MDKLSESQQARAIALEAASRIVAENLSKLSSRSDAKGMRQEAKNITTALARGFEEYLKDGSVYLTGPER